MHKQRALLACVVSNRAAKRMNMPSLPSPAPTITTLFDDFDAPDPIADCIQAGSVISGAHTWAILLVRCHPLFSAAFHPQNFKLTCADKINSYSQ